MRSGALTALVMLLGLVCACKSSPRAGSSASSAARRGTTENPWLTGMSQSNLGEPWRVQMNDDLEKAAARYPNLKLVLKDAQNDSLRQRAQVEGLVSQKIDLLIISPKETAPLTQPVAE